MATRNEDPAGEDAQARRSAAPTDRHAGEKRPLSGPRHRRFSDQPARSLPSSLLHNLKHNKILHEQNIILTVKTDDAPRVGDADRICVQKLDAGFWQVVLTYGYMETPDIPSALARLSSHGLKLELLTTSFFVSRRAIRPSLHSLMPFWQDKLFVSLAKSASDATEFFQIPAERVVEVGTQVTV